MASWTSKFHNKFEASLFTLILYQAVNIKQYYFRSNTGHCSCMCYSPGALFCLQIANLCCILRTTQELSDNL